MRATFFLLLIASSLWAQPVGKVVALDGMAKAVASDQSKRALQVDSHIYIADTIVVAAQSKIQIAFTDGSLLDLIPQTTYKIKAYQYKQAFQQDHYLAELAEGGFRTLSGSIAKKNPNGYEIETPNATIGIRGTIFEAVISNGITYFGCEQGLIQLSNNTGFQTIGPGEKSTFASAASRTTPFQTTSTRPQQLSTTTLAPPRKGLSADEVSKNPAAHPYSPQAKPQTRAAPQAAPGAAQRRGPTIGESPEEEKEAQQPGIAPARGSAIESSGC